MCRFWKMLLLLLLAGVTVLSMAACTTGTTGDPEQSTEGTSADVGDATEPDDPDQPAGEIVKAQREQLSFDAAVSIAEEGDSARVTHADGLSYLASNYTSLGGDVLHFSGELVLNFDATLTADAFNRFTLGYRSTQPLYGKVTYKVDGKRVTDDFYLEAGTDTFSCLIGQYLDGKKGQEITEMRFVSCNDQPAEFALCVLRVQNYPVYGNGADTYYIENDRYKLGIRLGWGGGINYLLDKQCPVEGLGNLVNQADTGRLIQQSYYGVVRNDEYTPGFFNGTEWCYNPVQGGDKMLNRSRIIDIVVTEQSVYIKAQPMDWGKENYITPSYMENSYTLYADRVLIDNRFVDFSGWTHRMASQELPAFYTVSYLSAFTFYNGTKPWTDDTLSYRNDLNFWGDHLWVGDCTFRLRASNTETWCAWTNPTDGYGFGLYVPGVDCFKAGCYQYNNSKDADDSATNYVAPLKNIMLESFEPLEYSYLIATGTVSELRTLFTTYRDFTANDTLNKNSESIRVPDDAEIYHEYYYDSTGKIPEREPETDQPAVKTEPVLDLTVKAESAMLIPTGNTVVKYDSAQTGTTLTVTGADPHVTISLGDAFRAEDYATLKIEYMLPKTNSPSNNVMDLFLCVGEVQQPHPDASIRVSLTADGEYHTLVVDLSAQSFWTGNIHSIRVDYLDRCEAGDMIYLKSLVLE